MHAWNGDTLVRRWTVLAGTSPDSLLPVGGVTRVGFETGVKIPKEFTHLRLRGTDAAGHAIVTTALRRV